MFTTRTFTFTPRNVALHLSCDPGTYYDPRTGVTLALPAATSTTAAATTNQRRASSQTQVHTTTTTTTTTQPQPTPLPLTTPPSTVHVTIPTTSPSNQSIDTDDSQVSDNDVNDGVPAYAYAAAVVGVLAAIVLALVAFLIIRHRQRCTSKNKALPTAVCATQATTAAAADLTHESISATQANEYTTNDDVSFSAVASVGPVNYCGSGGGGDGGTEGLYDEAINAESTAAASADGMTPPQDYCSPHACVSGPCNTELVNYSGHNDVDYVNHDTTANNSNSNHSYGTLDYAYAPNSDVTRTHPTSDKSDVTAYAYTSHGKDIITLPNHLPDDAEDTALTGMYAKPNKPPPSQPPPPVTMTKTLTVEGETIELEDNELYGASDD